jgi:ABC-2 type transport system ATP-binding protein
MSFFGVTDLVVRYGPTTAVCGVTLCVEPREVVALVGGDGAGKTSVLRALAGALASAEGGVVRPSETEIGYVPTGSGIYPDLTAQENLMFSGAAYGLGGRRLADRIDQLLATTNLDEARHRLAGAMSGGMRQKLALAAALVHEPRLLILDEPTTGVDPVSRAELWRAIAHAAAAGAAIVFATTYVEEAERASHVLALHAGRVLVEGAPADIVSSIPGSVTEVENRPQEQFVYRRGPRFRVWRPLGERRHSAGAVDLQDALTVAALRMNAQGSVA